jgi:hypothetical protein
MKRHKILVEVEIADDYLLNNYFELKNNPTEVKLVREIKISKDSISQLIEKFEEGNVEIVEQINKIVKTKPKRPSRYKAISCPFPYSCNAFPCETLCCNADVCSNGYAYRMS